MRSYVTVELDIVHGLDLPQGSMVAPFIADTAAKLLTEKLGGDQDPRLSVRAKVITAWIEHTAVPDDAR